MKLPNFIHIISKMFLIVGEGKDEEIGNEAHERASSAALLKYGNWHKNMVSGDQNNAYLQYVYCL